MSLKENNQSGIEIVTYNEKWEKTFILLEDLLKITLGDLILYVEHVGSTSVKGLSAKPILDIRCSNRRLLCFSCYYRRSRKDRLLSPRKLEL